MANPKAYREIQSENRVETTLGITSSALRALLNKWYPMTEPDEVDIEHEWDDNADEINGNVGPTEHTMTRKRASFSRAYNLSTEVFAMYLARVLPNIVSSAPLAAQSEVQTLTITGGAVAGSFVIVTHEGKTTPLISTVGHVDDAAWITAIDAALDDVYPTADFTVAGTLLGGFTVTFGAALADTPIGPMTAVVIDPFNAAGDAVFETTTEGRAAGTYSHRFMWPSLCAKVPPSFTMVEGFKCDDATGLTTTYFEYAGCVVSSLGLEINSNNVGDMNADIMGTGRELAVPAAAFPASPAVVTKLAGSMLKVEYTLDNGSNWVQIPVRDVRSVKIDIDPGIVETESLGGGTPVQEFQQGAENPTISPEVVFRGDKSHALWVAFKDSEFGERVGIRITLDPQTATRRVIMTMLQAVPQLELAEEDIETTITMTLMPEWIPAHGAGSSDGPAEFTIETGVSGYNIAA